MFEKSDYGKLISKELSTNLKEFTSGEDRADASYNSGVGASLIQQIVLRKASLTERNSVGIINLVNTAKDNCKGGIERQKEGLDYFGQMANKNLITV